MDRIFWKIKSDGRIRSKSLGISVVDDMHGPARSKRFYQEEQERIDLGSRCFAAFGKYGLNVPVMVA